MSTSETGPGQAPVCPRHPDRVAYVTCQRCDRPTCPACQVPSAVGVHCVDCAGGGHSGRAAGAQRSGAPGGHGGGGIWSRPSLLTEALIAACAVMFVASTAVPAISWQLFFVPALALSEPWRFATTAFLHAGVMHLAFNMWALWVFGTYLERLLGRWRFAVLYGLSALGGSATIFLFASPTSASWITPTVGASGAIFGLFSALFVIQRHFGRDTTQLLMIILANLLITALGSGISWQAHLGGLVTGAAVGAVMTSLSGRTGSRAGGPGRRRQAELWGSVAIAAALVAMVAVKALLV